MNAHSAPSALLFSLGTRWASSLCSWLVMERDTPTVRKASWSLTRHFLLFEGLRFTVSGTRSGLWTQRPQNTTQNRVRVLGAGQGGWGFSDFPQITCESPANIPGCRLGRVGPSTSPISVQGVARRVAFPRKAPPGPPHSGLLRPHAAVKWSSPHCMHFLMWKWRTGSLLSKHIMTPENSENTEKHVKSLYVPAAAVDREPLLAGILANFPPGFSRCMYGLRKSVSHSLYHLTTRCFHPMMHGELV